MATLAQPIVETLKFTDFIMNLVTGDPVRPLPHGDTCCRGVQVDPRATDL